MIERLIDWSVHNRSMVVLLTALLTLGGVWALLTTPVDAIPDLSDVQVIIFTEHPGQGPEVVEDQVTYPLTTSMLSVPFAKTVRGYSFFGFSMVYVIFEDGTDQTGCGWGRFLGVGTTRYGLAEGAVCGRRCDWALDRAVTRSALRRHGRRDLDGRSAPRPRRP